MPRRRRTPSYRLHKARKCGVVTIDGNDHYLGAYNSPESWEKYYRLLAEWSAAGRQAPVSPVSETPDLTIDELIAAYWQFAQAWYVKDGKPSGAVPGIKVALRVLRELYGTTGKACGLMYRILCDVTVRGKKTLEKALGVVELRLARNWNHGTDADPHIGSVMLAVDVLPFVGTFTLLEAGCREVWLTKRGGLTGIESSDSNEEVDRFKRFHGGDLARRFAYAGTADDRNQHIMSGRVR